MPVTGGDAEGGGGVGGLGGFPATNLSKTQLAS